MPFLFNYNNAIWEQDKKIQNDIFKNSLTAGIAGSAFHSAVIFVPFALEKDGYETYTGEWKVIAPICIANIGTGALGGLLSGTLAKSWVKTEDKSFVAFLKGAATGLLSGILWGTAIGSIWTHSTKKYDCEYSQYYDSYVLMSICSSAVVSSIGSGIVVIQSRWNIWSR